jgi:hypothetical protein
MEDTKIIRRRRKPGNNILMLLKIKDINPNVMLKKIPI